MRFFFIFFWYIIVEFFLEIYLFFVKFLLYYFIFFSLLISGIRSWLWFFKHVIYSSLPVATFLTYFLFFCSDLWFSCEIIFDISLNYSDVGASISDFIVIFGNVILFCLYGNVRNFFLAFKMKLPNVFIQGKTKIMSPSKIHKEITMNFDVTI